MKNLYNSPNSASSAARQTSNLGVWPSAVAFRAPRGWFQHSKNAVLRERNQIHTVQPEFLMPVAGIDYLVSNFDLHWRAHWRRFVCGHFLHGILNAGLRDIVRHTVPGLGKAAASIHHVLQGLDDVLPYWLQRTRLTRSNGQYQTGVWGVLRFLCGRQQDTAGCSWLFRHHTLDDEAIVEWFEIQDIPLYG